MLFQLKVCVNVFFTVTEYSPPNWWYQSKQRKYEARLKALEEEHSRDRDKDEMNDGRNELRLVYNILRDEMR